MFKKAGIHPCKYSRGHSSGVEAVAFSPGGQLITLASFDKTVRLWDAKTGAAGRTLEGHSDWVKTAA